MTLPWPKGDVKGGRAAAVAWASRPCGVCRDDGKSTAETAMLRIKLHYHPRLRAGSVSNLIDLCRNRPALWAAIRRGAEVVAAISAQTCCDAAVTPEFPKEP